LRLPGSISKQSSRKKLAAPFRSPLLQKTPSVVDSAPLTEVELLSSKQLIYPSTLKKNNEPEPNLAPASYTNTKKSHTSRAAKQFKSPLSLPSSSSSSFSLSTVQLAPTIQSLERKIQLLKRAIKVKKDGEEEELEGLIKKWKDVGREVAWEVWGLVKDSQMGRDQAGWGKEGTRGKGPGKRVFEEGWGWDDNDGAKKKARMGDTRWGWDAGDRRDNEEFGENRESVEDGEDEANGEEDTLGTMLRQLGIAPETFGWNEEEGEFVRD
jgi:hypothetical protein